MATKDFLFNTSVTVQKPIDDVWKIMGDFHDLSWCPSLVTSCEPVGDLPSTEPGAKRLVNGGYEERLRAYSAFSRKIGYAIDEGPSPLSSDEVSGFIVEIQLEAPNDSSTQVFLRAVWTAENDSAVAFCNSFYAQMLSELVATDRNAPQLHPA